MNSIVEWCSNQGQIYYILVNGFGTATGNFALTLDCGIAPALSISPVGPLKLSFGSPIRKRPTDRIQRLQFQIGTAF